MTRRGIQISLGLVWLLDGALQFQSFMYSPNFLGEAIEPTASMQPALVGTRFSGRPIWSGRT